MSDNVKLGLGFYLNYAKKSHKQGRILKNIMILLCALTIAISAIAFNFGDAFIKEQEKLLNEMSNREIFVVNKTTPLSVPIDMDENLSISQKESKSISLISEVEQIYPFYEFRSSGYDINLETAITESKLTINENNITKEHIFDSNNIDGFNDLIIMPYYPEQKLEERIFNTVNQDMTNRSYISHHLAELLNINHIDENLLFSLDTYVPIKLYSTTMYVGKENTQYDIDVDISKKVDLDFKIVGILNSNVRNTYTSSGENIIYVPYSRMQEILFETQKIPINSDETQDYKVWNPSAYVVFAKRYNDIQSIIKKISLINPNFAAVSNYQDINSMNKLIESTRYTARWSAVIILTIIFILMTIIYLNNTLRRKYEISILKANGMTKKELFKLVIADSLRHITFVSLISITISFVLVWIINLLFNFDVVKFGASVIIYNIGVSILSILLPTIIAMILVNRFKPDKIMRN